MGISWTLSQTVAEKFAQRAADENQEGKGIVILATCGKQHVKAYFDDNEQNEQEIIVFPDKLTIETEPITVLFSKG